jgi:hypothetical protein
LAGHLLSLPADADYEYVREIRNVKLGYDESSLKFLGCMPTLSYWKKILGATIVDDILAIAVLCIVLTMVQSHE